MKLRVAVFLVCLVVLSVSSVLAQTSGTGALSGTVTDSTGATVPNAIVTATNVDTNQSRIATTKEDGNYKIPLLQPGNYRVKFELTGFQGIEVPSVTITVTETAVLDRSLQVSTQVQGITVEAEAAVAVQTENSAIGTVVAGRTVTDLPLSTRNYTNLISLSAGANASVNNATAIGKGGVATAVNGAATNQNSYQMDGASVNNFFSFGTAVDSASGFYAGIAVPSPDAIQEFKIQTGSYDAGYGRNVGANVNVVTKSGSNALHGTAFEFFRNTALNANDWIRNFSGGKRLPFNQNQFGGVIGGPIKEDKLFFFASYQETQQKNGISALGFSSVILPPLPTAADRGTCPVNYTLVSQCDPAGQAFVANLVANTCPANATTASKKLDTTTVGGLQIGETVPGDLTCTNSNVNPVAVKILQLKLANGNYYVPGSGSATDYKAATFADPALYKEHQGIGNLDYLINSKNTLSVRFLDAPSINVAPIGCGNCLPGAPFQAIRSYLTVGTKLTSVVSNSLVNEVRMSYQRIIANSSNLGPLTNSQVGIQSIDPALDQLAYINASVFQIGNYWFGNQLLSDDAYVFGDQISWTRRKHNIRTGFEYSFTKAGITAQGIQIGDPIFGSFADFLIGRAAGPVASGGNGTSQSNVSGVGGSCQPQCTVWRANGGNLPMNFHTGEMNAFVQDDFKINSKLTLNLGLRWEWDGYATETGGKWSGIWPSLLNTQQYPGDSPATGSLVGFVAPSNYTGTIPAGVYQNNRSDLTRSGPPKNNFAPRLGFAWEPFAGGRFVVRGGGGFFYDRTNGNILVQAGLGAPPYADAIPNSALSTLRNPFIKPATIPGPVGTPGWTPRWVNYACDTNPTLASCQTLGFSSNLVTGVLGQNFTTPLVYQWNLGIQYQFLPTWVLELGYVGSHGIHQPGQANNGYGSGPPINTAVLATSAHPICADATHCVASTTVANALLRVPDLGFSTVWAPIESSGQFKYNSVQTTVRKQLSHGLSFQANYTWSRPFVDSFVGDPSATGAGQINYVERYGLNGNYRPHRFVFSYSWTIPTGDPKGLLGKAITGWNFSGVTTIQNGSPLSLTDSQSGTAFNSLGGGGVTGSSGPVGLAQFCPGMGPANLASSGSLSSRVANGLNGGSGFFAGTKATAALPCGSAGKLFDFPPIVGSDGKATGWGNSDLSIIRGPNQNNWDMSLSKLTTVGGLREDATLQFRAEFFNTFNHPQFSNPTTNVASGSFGRITSMSVNPRLLQFALKYAF